MLTFGTRETLRLLVVLGSGLALLAPPSSAPAREAEPEPGCTLDLANTAVSLDLEFVRLREATQAVQTMPVPQLCEAYATLAKDMTRFHESLVSIKQACPSFEPKLDPSKFARAADEAADIAGACPGANVVWTRQAGGYDVSQVLTFGTYPGQWVRFVSKGMPLARAVVADCTSGRIATWALLKFADPQFRSVSEWSQQGRQLNWQDAEASGNSVPFGVICHQDAVPGAQTTSSPARRLDVSQLIVSQVAEHLRSTGAPYYDLGKPLPAGVSDAFVVSARNHIAQYRGPWWEADKTNPATAKKLETLHKAAALPGCDKGNVVDCRPLFAAVDALATNGSLDDMTYALADLSAIECHAHTSATTCARAGELAVYEGEGSDERDSKVQATKLAYLAMACVDPRSAGAASDRQCDALISRLKRGDFGWSEDSLIRNLRHMACIHEPKASCAQLAP